MAEIFQNREQNIEHVGIYIVEHRMGFSFIAGVLENSIACVQLQSCGWAFTVGQGVLTRKMVAICNLGGKVRGDVNIPFL